MNQSRSAMNALKQLSETAGSLGQGVGEAGWAQLSRQVRERAPLPEPVIPGAPRRTKRNNNTRTHGAREFERQTGEETGIPTPAPHPFPAQLYERRRLPAVLFLLVAFAADALSPALPLAVLSAVFPGKFVL